MENESALGQERMKYVPKMPSILKDIASLKIKKINIPSSGNLDAKLKEFFPHISDQSFLEFIQEKVIELKKVKVGVVFSGGQAPGGHNVISGLYDALKLINGENELIGFLDGPSGIVENKSKKITSDEIKRYRNRGGFDFLGSGRTKIETDEQLNLSAKTMQDLKLDGLVVIGGDDSNTNAAVLAEYFLNHNIDTKVIGIPKTIDGDLKNEYLPTSFGFDTATKVFSELIGNIAIDALSAKKYYHFIKLMGRSASHITLECALKTNPNFAFIAEEIEKNNSTLEDIVADLASMIVTRSEQGKNYGIVLIPEGLIEFIPEIKALINELNDLLFHEHEKFSLLVKGKEKIEFIASHISDGAKKTFLSLPEKIQKQLLLDRDPHGNVQVSKIETEYLLIEKVKEKLKNTQGYKGKFSAQAHFLGYEGRAAYPSNFDANYCYNLGFIAAALIKEGATGYLCSIKNLSHTVDKWEPLAIPLVSLMNIEKRKGKDKPVIKKALVDTTKKPFNTFDINRKNNEQQDLYINPGPIQYFGPDIIVDTFPITLIEI